MADQPDEHEKTEEPTHKKLEDAHRKGDVAKSQEVNSWFMMLGATLVFVLFAEDVARSLAGLLRGLLAGAHAQPMDGGGLRDLVATLGLGLLAVLAVPFVMLLLAALAGNLVQHRLVFSVEPIKPKLSKISLVSGAKRLFSAASLVNFGKALAKLAIVATAMLAIVWPNRDRLDSLIATDPAALLGLTQGLANTMMIAVLAVLAVVAALDFAYQRHTWWEKQRMTAKELRDEYKQMEGDPQVRAKIRQIRVERGRKRMMANVPRASVVITNPTHYAVALRYETGMNAPVCLAKGTDAVALKIREVARAHAVPIVENVALARTLHASVEVDEEIPPQHYKAVAEVIGYVMRLRTRRAWRS